MRLNIDLDATASGTNIVAKRVELRLRDLEAPALVSRRPDGRYMFTATDARQVRCIERIASRPETRAEAARLIYIRPLSGAAAFADAFGAPRPPNE